MVNEILKADIPDDWNIKKLEPDVGFVRSGKRLPKGYYVTSIPTQHPYIRVADMRAGYVDVDGLMYVPDEAYFRIQKYRIYRDDIYISVAGTLGIVGQIPDYLDGANLTENANRITDIKCNIKFLMYWLMSSKIQGLINQTQTLGAQPKLALTRIRNFPIILPPIEEQEQIVEVLCNVDTLITNLRKLIRKKKDIRQGTMQMLVTGKKRLSGFDGNWRVTTLDQLCYIVTICRVNRLDDDTKDFGYIVDYKQLFGQLQTAMKDYTSGAFEGYDPEDVKGLVKDRHDATVSYFEEVYDAVEELCEGVEEPRGEIQYIHYFCGVSGQSEESDEIYARLREKLYRLVSSLVRAFAEAKPYLIDDISSGKLNEYDKKVTFYIELKKTIGTASGDFLDLKAYEPDMRKMIDNYITAADAEKIGDFDDLTLLDFVAKQGETLTGEGDSGHKEGAAEAIENNIRKKVIEKVTVNPRYYAKMSEILDKLIEERKQGVLDYAEMLEKYIKLAKDVDCPEDNDKYPESIRKSKALMAIYDNTGEDEKLAIRIHKAVKKQALFGFRDNQVVIRRIKKALYEILGDDSEVERIYKIIEKQEEL